MIGEGFEIGSSSHRLGSGNSIQRRPTVQKVPNVATFTEIIGELDDANFDAKVKQLRKDFKFLGDFGSYYFLYVVGEEVPPHEEYRAARGR